MIIARLPELAAWHIIVTDKKYQIKYPHRCREVFSSLYTGRLTQTRCYGQLNKCTVKDIIQYKSVASECEVRALA